MRALDPLAEDDVVRLAEPVRRLLTGSDGESQDVEDLTQETLLRVWEVRGRVDRTAAEPYALAVARNLLVGRHRQRQVHRRHAHRMFDPGEPVHPEDVALRREQQKAAVTAVAGLDPADRELLEAHYGPAGQGAPRTAGLTSRLARARGRARVDYLLAVRLLALPTARCRTVLEALSAGDRRGQQRIGAGRHLSACSVCSDCAPALLSRRRDLCGLPMLLGWHWVRQTAAARPRTTATGAAATVAAGVAAAVMISQSASSTPARAVGGGSVGGGAAGGGSAAQPATATPPPASRAAPRTLPATPTPLPAQLPAGTPPPSGAPAVPSAPAAARAPEGPEQPTGSVLSAGRRLLPAGPDRRPLTGLLGSVAIGRSVPVQSVPADEGFWVGSRADRIWVQLRTVGESGPASWCPSAPW